MSGTSDYTVTPNLGLFKPIANMAVGTWGDLWNSNADAIDSAIHASTGGGPFLPLAGNSTVFGPTTFTAPLIYTATGATNSRAAQDRWGEHYNAKDFGCVCDGVTDDGARLNTALTTIPNGTTLYIPGPLYTTQTILVEGGRRLLGASVMLRRPIPNDHATWVSDFAIIGSATLSPVVRVMNSLGPGGGVDNLAITRNGTPAAGTIGLQCIGGNQTYWKVYSFNHAIGIQCGAPSASPVNGQYVTLTGAFDHCEIFQCYENFVYLINAPEMTFYDCRWGINGGVDPAGATALVTIDGDNNRYDAGSTNTVTFLRCQFNTGGNPLYGIRFYNLNSDGVFKFIGCYSGGAQNAFIFVDPNCTIVQMISLDTTTISPLHSGEVLISDAGHKMTGFIMMGCHVGGGVAAPAITFSLSGIVAQLIGNKFNGGFALQLDSMAGGCFIGNSVSTMTFSGAYTGEFTVSGNYGVVHDTATGPIVLLQQNVTSVGPISIISPVDNNPIRLATPSNGLNYFLHLMPGDATRPNAVFDTPFLIGTAGGLTAVPGGQAAATQIVAQIAYIGANGNTGNGVKLPASGVGYWQVITNATALSTQVYGTAPDTINGVATATGVPLAPGKTMQLYCYQAGAWFGGVLT